MPFITQGKANLKYILIVVVLAAMVGGGILGYQYWWIPKQKSETSEVVVPEIKTPEKVSLGANGKLYACSTNLDCVLVGHKSCEGIIKISINKEYESQYSSSLQYDDSVGGRCMYTGFPYDEKKQIIDGQVPTKSLCLNNECVPKYLEDETANWKIYRNKKYGFELKYPEKLEVIEKEGKVFFHHSIPYENDGPCDMTGPIFDSSGKTITYEKLDDFNVSFEIAPEKKSLDYSDGEYDNGNIKGNMQYVGIEGCGYYLYYFPLGSYKTLIIQDDLVQAFLRPGENEAILKIPGVIFPEENKRIFDQMLSTFKVLD